MVSTEVDTLLLIVPCLLLGCSIIFNSTGRYYLQSLRNSFTNHKILLINLSLVEILSCVAMIVYWFDGYFKFCNFRTVSSPNSITVACTFGFAIDWYFYLLCLLSPMTLLPDRFIAIKFPYNYRSIFSKQKAIFTVVAQWIIIAIVVTQLLFVSHQHWLKYLQCAAITIEVMVFASATITYSWIVAKLRKRGNLFDRASVDSRVLRIAILITLTFLCLVVIPEVTLFTLTQLHGKMADTYQRIFYTVTCVNYVSDPLIYILGYPPLREAVGLLKRKPKSNQLENASNTDELSEV